MHRRFKPTLPVLMALLLPLSKVEAVGMNGLLHCALFRPASLDFWVANAASPMRVERYQACWQAYRQLNLRELLRVGKEHESRRRSVEYDEVDHTRDMRSFGGVPLIVEEHPR